MLPVLRGGGGVMITAQVLQLLAAAPMTKGEMLRNRYLFGCAVGTMIHYLGTVTPGAVSSTW